MAIELTTINSTTDDEKQEKQIDQDKQIARGLQLQELLKQADEHVLLNWDTSATAPVEQQIAALMTVATQAGKDTEWCLSNLWEWFKQLFSTESQDKNQLLSESHHTAFAHRGPTIAIPDSQYGPSHDDSRLLQYGGNTVAAPPVLAR